MQVTKRCEPDERRFPWVVVVVYFLCLGILLSLGTWQVQRLFWKEALLQSIAENIKAPALPLSEMEDILKQTHSVEYRPVTVTGTFMHDGERHFLATFRGESGFYIYTPLQMEDGRFVLINRGFVPYARKDAQTRLDGQLDGPVTITGLARDRLDSKPSSFVPDNDPVKNIFYWKDWSVMSETAGVPDLNLTVPFFIDADDTANPGVLPMGGVTNIELPNKHLEYAITWYGLALALTAVVGAYLWRWRYPKTILK
ncbi:SURF1 family protein [Brucellaceae bacterium C25G]